MFLTLFDFPGILNGWKPVLDVVWIHHWIAQVSFRRLPFWSRLSARLCKQGDVFQNDKTFCLKICDLNNEDCSWLFRLNEVAVVVCFFPIDSLTRSLNSFLILDQALISITFEWVDHDVFFSSFIDSVHKHCVSCASFLNYHEKGSTLINFHLVLFLRI